MKITQFRIHGLLLLACAMLSLVACNPPEPEPEPEPAAKVTVSGGQSVTALPQGGDLTISFTANKQWSISVNKGSSTESWISCAPNSGSAGDCVAIVSTTANETGAQRVAVITITAGDASASVTVTQGEWQSITAEDRTEKVGYEGGNVSFSYKSIGDVSVKSDSDWIKYIETKAQEQHTAMFEVGANTGAARTGKVTFSCGGKSVVLTVEQDAFVEVFSLSQQAVTVGSEGGTVIVEVTSNLGYHVSTSVSWIHEVTTRATSKTTHTFAVDANTTVSQRAGAIVFCNDKELCIPVQVTQEAGESTLTLSRSSASFDAAGGNVTVDVTSNDSWTATSDADWCTLSGASGKDNGSITIKASANLSVASRTAAVTVKCAGGSPSRTVEVTQGAGESTLTLSKSSVSVDAAGGNVTVDVTSNDSWTATSDADWCTLSGASGKNNGSITIKTSANPTVASRTAVVTVKCAGGSTSRAVEVTQGAGESTLTLSRSSASFDAAGGNVTVDVTSNDSWTATSDADWCFAEPEEGKGDGKLTIEVGANPSTSTRSAVVTVKCKSGNITKSFKLTQTGCAPELSLSVDSYNFPAEGGDLAVNVTSNDKWTVSSTASWCTLSDTGGEGSGSVILTAAVNGTVSSRSAVVTFKCTSGQLSKAITITQEAGGSMVELLVDEVSVACGASTTTTSISSNTSWTASSDSQWCTVSPGYGTGNAALTVRVEENPSLSARTARVMVVSNDGKCSRVLTVVQAGQPQTLEVNLTSKSVGCDATTFSVEVSSNAPWTVKSEAAWCSLSASSGKENGSVVVSVAENGNVVSRSTRIVFVSGDGSVTRTITVIQAAGTPVLSLNRTEASFGAQGGTESVTISSNADWKVSVDAAWCSVDVASGTGDAAINVSAQTNATVDERQATLTVKTVDGSIVKTVALKQNAGNATLELSANELSFEYAKNGANVTVQSNTTWKVTCDASWCTITKSSLGGGFTVNVSENLTGKQRTATITVKTDRGDATATISVTQKAKTGNEGFGDDGNITWD